MTNRDEVLPDKLMEKINIKNFANKQWESEPSVITKYNNRILSESFFVDLMLNLRTSPISTEVKTTCDVKVIEKQAN